MIVTKEVLQQLIDEEFSRALEKRKKRLTERFHASSEMYEMDAVELIEFAKAYRDMGNAVQDQLDDILDNEQADANPNAVALIKRSLGGSNSEIDYAITAWMEYQTGTPGGEPEDEGGSQDF